MLVAMPTSQDVTFSTPSESTTVAGDPGSFIPTNQKTLESNRLPLFAPPSERRDENAARQLKENKGSGSAPVTCVSNWASPQ